MTFKDPLILLALPVLFFAFFFLRKKRAESAFLFPSYEAIKSLRPSAREFFSSNLIYARLIVAALAITALARPQLTSPEREKRDAIAIMIAVDCSSTMLAEDLALGPSGLEKLQQESGDKRPNRLDAVKDVAKSFIKSRKDDLIGLVAFGAEAYVLCPPTFDKEWLGRSVDRLKVGLVKDGTAIGSGVMSSMNALKDSGAKGNVIILLTDGVNNAGQIPPLVSAKSARALGMKIYTIGIMSKGQTPYPVIDKSGKKAYQDVRIEINDDVLKKMSEETGGAFFAADDLSSLDESYREIDKIERSSVEERSYAENKDVFGRFLWPALIILLLDIVLGNTILRKIP